MFENVISDEIWRFILDMIQSSAHYRVWSFYTAPEFEFQHDPRPVKQTSTSTTQSQPVWMQLLMIFQQKNFGNCAMVSRRSSSALIGFEMFHFSLEFHMVLWALEG